MDDVFVVHSMKIVPAVAHSAPNAGLKTQWMIEVEYKTIKEVRKLNLRQLDEVSL